MTWNVRMIRCSFGNRAGHKIQMLWNPGAEAKEFHRFSFYIPKLHQIAAKRFGK